MGKMKGFAPAAIVFIFLIIASILIALLLVGENVDELKTGKVEMKDVYEFQNASYALGKQGFLIYCNHYQNPVIPLSYTNISGDSVMVGDVWVKNRIFNITEKVNDVFEGSILDTTVVSEKVQWLNTHGESCVLSTYEGSHENCAGSIVFNITCAGNDVETSEGIKKFNISYYGYVSE